MTAGLIEIPGYVTGTWTIDPAHSDVGFVIRHLGISNVKGHFTRFGGQILTAEDPLRSGVTATIDMTSIDTANAARDAHLRSADFFEVEKYPTMTFVSTGIKQAEEGFVLEGDLTLKGVTKTVAFDLEVSGFGPDAYGGTRVGFSAISHINRIDFGVSFNGPIPGVPGGVAVSENVTINLEIEGVLQA